MTPGRANAKVNLALVVGPLRADGRHEVATVMERLDLADGIELETAAELRVEGFSDDTLVRSALESLAAAAGVDPCWRATIRKEIPVAGGLGGGSSNAAIALRLANETLPAPLPPNALHDLAAELGADVPFFLTSGPQLAKGAGTELTGLDLPRDYHVVLLLPHGVRKESTATAYALFDELSAEDGYEERRAALLEALAAVHDARDLAALPPNDLASSPLAGALLEAGAFRADVTGAGPVVYGLFDDHEQAAAAERELRRRGRTWLTSPAWYG